MLDPYEVLGVERAADDASVQRAYRVLAKRLHPDLNPGDPGAERRFKALSEAYAILGNPRRRLRWDRGEREGLFDSDHFAFEDNEPDPGPAAPRDGRARIDLFEDFYSDITPGEALRSGRRGHDVDYRITVPFLLAARGGAQRLRLAGEREIEVEIPAGIEDGELLRVAGAGLAGGEGGVHGDAMLRVSVQPHALFTRQGADLHLELPVGLREAVVGARVRVPTLSGSVVARIPAGSDGKTRLRLKGRGLPLRGRGRGDLYLRLVILLPENPPPSLGMLLSTDDDRSAADAREELLLRLKGEEPTIA
jgi:DnaJ-class molecular chaperone